MKRLLRLLPNLLVVAALFLAGDVVYQEYGSNLVAARRAETVRESLRTEWKTTQPSRDRKVGKAVPPTVTRRSQGFGLLYIPRLRSAVWELPVLSGTSEKELNVGVGHREESALPWQDGNVVLSGHRTSHGRPFAEIEKLRAGDQVFLETRDAWYVYTLVDDAVVKPDALWVTKTTPIPALNGENRVLTLITCTPKGSVDKRWVWWGKLTEVREKNALPEATPRAPVPVPTPSPETTTPPPTSPHTLPDTESNPGSDPALPDQPPSPTAPEPVPLRLEGQQVSGFSYESSKLTRRLTRELDVLVGEKEPGFAGRIECQGLTGYNSSRRSPEFLRELGMGRASAVCGYLAEKFPAAEVVIVEPFATGSTDPSSRGVVVAFSIPAILV